MIVSFENGEQDNRENWTPRGLASLIAKRQSSGEDARCLIAPTPIDLQSEERSFQSYTASGRKSSAKTAKNHFLANRKALKERQRNIKNAAIEAKELEEQKLKRKEQKKEKRFGRIKSRVFEPTASSSIKPTCPSTAISQNSGESPQRPTFSPDASNGETPSDQQFHIAFGKKVFKSAPASCQSNDVQSHRLLSSKVERHKSYGKVPSYITNRRAKIEREEQERQLMEQNAPPAPGLVLMAESERLETLRVLEESEMKERETLRNIPFSMNGHRAARLREAIEYRLKEIEDLKKTFSRDRVFVAQSSNADQPATT